jgi:hypothetical protein
MWLKYSYMFFWNGKRDNYIKSEQKRGTKYKAYPTHKKGKSTQEY